MYAEAGLDAASILGAVFDALGKDREAAEAMRRAKA
jgi:hypothetical protein